MSLQLQRRSSAAARAETPPWWAPTLGVSSGSSLPVPTSQFVLTGNNGCQSLPPQDSRARCWQRCSRAYSLVPESCGSVIHPPRLFPRLPGQTPTKALAARQTTTTGSEPKRCDPDPTPKLRDTVCCYRDTSMPPSPRPSILSAKEQQVFSLIKKQSSSLQRYACVKLCQQINRSGPQARGSRTITLPQFTCWISFCPAAWSRVKGSCSEAGSRQENKSRENTSRPKGTVGKLVIGPCVFGFRQASRFVFPRLEPRLKETQNY